SSYLSTFGLGTESARIGGLVYIFRDLSAVLLAALAYRTVEPPAALVITAGLVTFTAFSALFHVNFVVATVLMGLVASIKASMTPNLRMHAVLASLLTMPAALLTDPAGLTSGIVWTLCLGSATFAAWALALPSAAPLYAKVRNAPVAGWLATGITCL